MMMGTPSPEDTADYFEFEVGPFTVPAGAERYLCFTTRIDDAFASDMVKFESHPVVHHLIFAKALAPEPEGMSECDVLFRSTWSPIFLSGTGDSDFALPEGAAFEMKADTQVVAQLHLLNVTTSDVTETVKLRMRKRVDPAFRKVGIMAFGTTNIALEPGGTGQATGDCDLSRDVTLFAAFPHMHTLGTSMIVEAGATADTMTEVFRRSPYDFDDQWIEDMPLELKQGDHVRVRCEYENSSDQTITYGESSLDEMCYFVGYAVGTDRELDGCIDSGGGASGIRRRRCRSRSASRG